MKAKEMRSILLGASVFLLAFSMNGISKARTENANVEVYNSSELTHSILENRNGDIVIERTIGVVKNDNKDGEILNPADEERDYISYRSVDGCKKGDKVMTYFVYNPGNNKIDDVMYRTDYIIGSAEE